MWDFQNSEGLNQGCFISEDEQRARKRREDNVNGSVLADFTWDFRALLSHSCLFLCSLFLLQLHLPQLTQHSPTLIPVSEQMSLVARSHQASRCSLQPVFSSMACSRAWFTKIMELVESVKFHVLLRSCYFFQERVTQARQPLFCLPIREIPSGTQFCYLLPQTSFLIDIMPYFYPSSSFYSLLLLSQKTTAILQYLKRLE